MEGGDWGMGMGMERTGGNWGMRRGTGDTDTDTDTDTHRQADTGTDTRMAAEPGSRELSRLEQGYRLACVVDPCSFPLGVDPRTWVGRCQGQQSKKCMETRESRRWVSGKQHWTCRGDVGEKTVPDVVATELFSGTSPSAKKPLPSSLWLGLEP